MNEREAFLKKAMAMSNEEICKALDYEKPEYTASKTNAPLRGETMEALNKLFTNLDLPVSAFKLGGMLSGMYIIKQSRAAGDIREIAGRMIEAKPQFLESMQKMVLPDFINEVGSGYAKAVINEYGDDSAARCITFQTMFQGISLLQCMNLFHHRVLFGIEKSTRYMDYSKKDAKGRYQYIVDPIIKEKGLEEEFRQVTDKMFDIYAEVMNTKSDAHKKVKEYLHEKIPYEEYKQAVLSWVEKEKKAGKAYEETTEEELQQGYEKTISAAFKDQVRHIIPLSAKNQLGLEYNAEAMRLALLHHQNRYSGEGILIAELWRREIEKLASPLVEFSTPDHPRAKAYREFYTETKEALSDVPKETIVSKPKDITFDEELKLQIEEHGDFLKTVDEELGLEVMMDPQGTVDDILVAILEEKMSSITFPEAKALVKKMSDSEKKKMLWKYTGINYHDFPFGASMKKSHVRSNRRHRPGRAFETVKTKLSMIMPVAEIRDIRRHTLQTYFDPLYFTPELGFYVSPGLKATDLGKALEEAYEHAAKMWKKLHDVCGPYVASTVLPQAVRAPMNTEFNARNMFHLSELRTQVGAAPVYLRLCQMNYALLKKALPDIAETMLFVNKGTEIDYGRALQEARSIARRKAGETKVDLA